MGRAREPGYRPSIVYFVSTLTKGGAQIGMIRLLEGLDLDRYDVTVLSVLSKTNDVRSALPEEVTLVDLEEISFQRKPLVLYQTIDMADVLVCSLYHATIIGRIVGAIAKTPVVLNWQHSERFAGTLRELVYVKTSGLSDLILADSSTVAAVLVEDFDFERDRVRTVPIAGVDTTEFAPTGTTSPAGKLHVATVGSLIPPKKHVRVLQTARAVQRLDSTVEFTFNIAGTGPLEAKLRQQRDDLGLENVRFHGFVEDVPSFLNRNDVYFHTSEYEGLCIAALEAMACELPVVSTRAGGLGSYVEHGESGYLVDDPDPEVFADYLARFGESDRRRAFGRRGRTIVEREYSQAVLVSAFEDVLEECLLTESADELPGTVPGSSYSDRSY